MKQQYVSFNITSDERRTIKSIAERKMNAKMSSSPTDDVSAHKDIMMDISACHCNGCPLRLTDLLSADDFNFAHDVNGIMFHIDRTNGKLKDHFLPRFAKRWSDLKSPWGNNRDGYMNTVASRINAIKSMDLPRILQCLAWPNNQKAVDNALRRAASALEI